MVTSLGIHNPGHSCWYTKYACTIFRNQDINTYRVHVNDNASNSDHSGISLPHILYLLFSNQRVSILVSIVYVNILEQMAVTGIITPVLQKAESSKFSKRLEAASIIYDFYKT